MPTTAIFTGLILKIPNKRMLSIIIQTMSRNRFYSINMAGLNGRAVLALFLGSYFCGSDSENT